MAVDTVWRSFDAADVVFTYFSVRISILTTESANGVTKCSPSSRGGTVVSTALQCRRTPRWPASTI